MLKNTIILINTTKYIIKVCGVNTLNSKTTKIKTHKQNIYKIKKKESKTKEQNKET